MHEEDYWQTRSSQEQFHQEQLYSSQMNKAVTDEEYARFALLKPSIQSDGNMWCVLYGADLQVGIAGFGKTPHEAIMDWDNEFNKKIKQRRKEEGGTE